MNKEDGIEEDGIKVDKKVSEQVSVKKVQEGL